MQERMRGWRRVWKNMLSDWSMLTREIWILNYDWMTSFPSHSKFKKPKHFDSPHPFLHSKKLLTAVSIDLASAKNCISFWYTMFRTSLLCYLWSELTEIWFFFKAYNIFNKKTCKSKFWISTPNKAPFRRSCHIYTFTPLWLDITQWNYCTVYSKIIIILY
jgi:hypothetical protein